MYGALFDDEEFVRAATAVHVDLVRDYDPDVVVDSFGLFSCLAARILQVPLASVLQGNFHPASRGFLWWKGERPDRIAQRSTRNQQGGRGIRHNARRALRRSAGGRPLLNRRYAGNGPGFRATQGSLTSGQSSGSAAMRRCRTGSLRSVATNP